MGIDIRIPIGLMFAIFGLLLTLFGVATDKSIYVRSLNININLGWGLVLLVFGGVMLAFGRRGMSQVMKESGSNEQVVDKVH